MDTSRQHALRVAIVCNVLLVLVFIGFLLSAPGRAWTGAHTAVALVMAWLFGGALAASLKAGAHPADKDSAQAGASYKEQVQPSIAGQHMNSNTSAPIGPTSGRVTHVAVNADSHHLALQRVLGGHFAIVGFSGIQPGDTHLGYRVQECAPQVQNLDFESDSYECFAISDRVRVDGISFGSRVIECDDLEAIRAAAKHLVVATYDCREL